MGTSTSEKWDMAASSKMTLSIQLISDSGEPIVDSVITGSGTELRDQMSQLFIGKLPTGILPGTDVDAPQQPQYSSEGGFIGGQSNPAADYKLSGANAGSIGGERTKQVGADGVAYDNSLGRPPIDAISLDERSRQIYQQQQNQSVGQSDGGGSRVNQESNVRNYELGNYETGVMINPERHQFDKAAVQEAERRKASTLDSVGVPYEVAGVTNKIKNIHRVGGERVKEMDHFVAAVSTPVVDVMLKGPDGKLVKAKRNNDIGTHVGISTRDAKLGKSVLLSVIARGFKWPVLVESSYMNSGDQKRTKHEEISSNACSFISLIHDAFHVLNLPVEDLSRCVHFYYMTTLRMDELVCCMSPSTKKLYLNVQAFQQQMYSETSETRPGGPLRSTIRKTTYHEALSTWVSRIHLAIRDGQWSNVQWIQSSKKNGDPCMGLYDAKNRARYEQLKNNYR